MDISLNQYSLPTCSILKGKMRHYWLLLILRRKELEGRTAKKRRLLVRLLKMNIVLTPRYVYNVFHPRLNLLSLRYLQDRYCSHHFIEGKTDAQKFSNWPKVTWKV